MKAVDLTPEIVSKAFQVLENPEWYPELPKELQHLPHQTWVEIEQLLILLMLEKEKSRVHQKNQPKYQLHVHQLPLQTKAVQLLTPAKLTLLHVTQVQKLRRATSRQILLHVSVKHWAESIASLLREHQRQRQRQSVENKHREVGLAHTMSTQLKMLPAKRQVYTQLKGKHKKQLTQPLCRRKSFLLSIQTLKLKKQLQQNQPPKKILPNKNA